MSKTPKIWLIVASLLIVFGIFILGIVACLIHFDFTKLNTSKYETNIYNITETFSNISIKTISADVLFLPSDDGTCKVLCHEHKKIQYSANVQDGTLNIQSIDQRKWYEYISFNFNDNPELTIYLPNDEYASLSMEGNTSDIEIPNNFKFENIHISISTGDIKCLSDASESIKIRTTTGNIALENLSANTISLSASTGDTTLSDITCKNLISNAGTGDLILNRVIVAEKISVERSTGDITFRDCDASEIFVETDTGDVTGSLLSEKIFITKTSTGDVDVPETKNGGRCEIITSTGDIKLSIR